MAHDSDDPVYTNINKLGDLQDVKDTSVEPTDKSTLVYSATDDQYVQTAPSATIADVAALTGGEPPTEAEFNALATTLNTLLAACKAHGIIASS